MVDILPEEAPAPRLCHLIKWPDFDGYGFNLHAERANPGQFIGKIDESSPAEMAGLREGDRIVEVNGVNISNENHRQVVERIKAEPQEAKLLVVDPEADAWYKEQGLVIRSSQLNVVYMRTPTPRPQPDSPRAKFHNNKQQDLEQQVVQSSLISTDVDQASNPVEASLDTTTTSDFNDDSIEQQQQQQQQRQQQQSSQHQPTTNGSKASLLTDDELQQVHQQKKEELTRRLSPPMSPDSGKGDEEGGVAAAAGSPELVVEAEINRQSSTVQRRPLSPMLDSDSVEADSLRSQQMASGSSCQMEQNEEQLRAGSSFKANGNSNSKNKKNRNGSADSGQSSSADTGSSMGSIVDSLEQESEPPQQVAASKSTTASEGRQENVAVPLTRPASRLAGDNEDAITIKNYLNAASKQATNEQRAEITALQQQGEKTTTTPTTEACGNGKIGEKQQVVTTKQAATLRSALVNNNNSKNHGEAISQQNIINNNNNTVTQQQQDTLKQQTKVGSNNNNNYSGLNLNMTASEMRELLARRKKFDPKKAQMNIRQKYEIIQQM